MTNWSAFQSSIVLFLASFIPCCPAWAQVLYQEQTIEVHGLPSLMARSKDPADVLLTSLDTVIHDREICCGKDSALGDSAEAADPMSLQEVAKKLNGRHLLSDGRPILVTAEFLAPDAVTAAYFIKMMTDQHAALMMWNSHLYVVRGITYFWTGTKGEEGGPVYAVTRKFLLVDPRYSGEPRHVELNRETQDASRVQGLLFVQSRME